MGFVAHRNSAHPPCTSPVAHLWGAKGMRVPSSSDLSCSVFGKKKDQIIVWYELRGWRPLGNPGSQLCTSIKPNHTSDTFTYTFTLNPQILRFVTNLVRTDLM